MKSIYCIVSDGVARFATFENGVADEYATIAVSKPIEIAALARMGEVLLELSNSEPDVIPVEKFPVTIQDIVEVLDQYNFKQEGMTTRDIANELWFQRGTGGAIAPKWVLDAVRNRITATDKASAPPPWRRGLRQAGDPGRAARYFPLHQEPELPFESTEGQF